MRHRRLIDVLWGARRREQSAALQERWAQWSTRSHPAMEMRATPIHPPVKDERRG